jgi:Zn-dependent protease
MAWSFQIGRIFGIDIRVHYIFVAFVALLCLQEIVLTGSFQYGAQRLFQILMLFGFVLLHELGHSLMAQRAGIRVIDIVLWPLGGLARLQGQSNDPVTEVKIASAGPAVNLAIALAVFPLWYFLADGNTATVLFFIMAVNVILGGFNLIPAFPMDGGRILRSLMARRVSYVRATALAVSIGRTLAWIFLFLAIVVWSNYWLAIICLFVLWAGSAELRAVRANEMLKHARNWGIDGPEIIDAEVVSSGEADPDAASRDPRTTMKDYEQQFIDMVRRHRKDREGS